MNLELLISTFLLVSCTVLLTGLLFSGHRGYLAHRMSGMAGPATMPAPEAPAFGRFASRVVPRLAVPLVPQDEQEQGKLTTQLIQAGLYGQTAMPLFLGTRMLLIVIPLVMGILAGTGGLVSLRNGVLLGASAAIVGLVSPRIWLRQRKRARQAEIRRTLPDALDMIVVCIDGGMSLPAALQQVGRELRVAHPLISRELGIVNRATDLGQSLTEALEQFAARFDLEQLRYLASIVTESEQYGTSVAKSLRVHAETLRTQRTQRAEELARKAAVKVLFPTLLFILPVIFVVVLAPSIIRIMEVLDRIVK